MEKSELPQGVTLYYTDRAVHLTTDAALLRFLRQRGNGSLPLSRAILEGYAAARGTALNIRARSMATELLLHAYLDCVFTAWLPAAQRLRSRPGRRLCALLQRLKRSTAVIDMGERSVDTNRWVFDLLSPFYGLLCLLLGSRA